MPTGRQKHAQPVMICQTTTSKLQATKHKVLDGRDHVAADKK